MYSEISVQLLQVHPKNSDYFAELPSEKYEEIKQSIAAHGIRDPLKVLSDYTIVAGHQRLRIAKELGFEKVPVIVLDIAPEEAEYLLIADNEERRQGDDNPMRKARRAEFLKQYWSIREGKLSKPGTPEGQFGLQAKTLADVADAIGENERTAKRLLKLNDLIPPLQALVSTGSLTQTAAYSLAFLSQDEQQKLLNTLGDSGVCELSGKDAQSLREELSNIQKEKEALASQLTELQEERTMLSDQLSDLQDAFSAVEEEAAEDHSSHYEELRHEVFLEFQEKLDAKTTEVELLRAKLQSLTDSSVEKTIEKIVYAPDPVQVSELEAIRKQATELLKEKQQIEARFHDVVGEKEQKETLLRAIKEETEKLKERLAHAQSELIKEKERPKPPQWSKEHMDFRAAMETASQSAASLASALTRIQSKHLDLFLHVSRICNTADDTEMDEAIEILGDTMLFNRVMSALDAAADKIICTQDMLEPTKPKLHVVKNPKTGGDVHEKT